MLGSRILRVLASYLFGAFVATVFDPSAIGQSKGKPGAYDFYLLNLSWAADFCSIQGTNDHCSPPTGFVVHGLWPQNNDGSYPVFCAERPGPVSPQHDLDLTPDLSLLDHEWKKHGTCTTLTPEGFFGLERAAAKSLAIPQRFLRVDHPLTLRSAEILDLFQRANPSYPEGSILLSCVDDRLTAVEACYSRSSLQPTACRGLPACDAHVLRILPAVAK